MRVFDFDNTIYNGESVFDFYLFSIKKNPKVIKYLFVVVYNLLKYKAGKTTMADLEEAVKKYAIDYLTAFDSYDELVNEFWDSHIHKIKKWYKPQSDDVIMTASLNLIMDELCRRLGRKKTHMHHSEQRNTGSRIHKLRQKQMRCFQRKISRREHRRILYRQHSGYADD